jgi:hypothetical protein
MIVIYVVDTCVYPSTILLLLSPKGILSFILNASNFFLYLNNDGQGQVGNGLPAFSPQLQILGFAGVCNGHLGNYYKNAGNILRLRPGSVRLNNLVSQN